MEIRLLSLIAVSVSTSFWHHSPRHISFAPAREQLFSAGQGWFTSHLLVRIHPLQNAAIKSDQYIQQLPHCPLSKQPGIQPPSILRL